MSTIVSLSVRLWVCIALLMHAPAFAFDVDDLEALVRDNELRSIDEVIARLPDEYKRNYTLSYDSQSLQGASYANPRAVLFGDTAQLVLSFNGAPSQRHYQAIEAMQFREGSETFELYSIDFSGDRARFSEPNPEICSSCHGSPPHPIWSSYEYGEKETSHWPGFFGSAHDAPGRDEKEAAAYKRFKQKAPTHPRYRHLVLDSPDSEWFPYGYGPLEHRFRPNNRLGNLLARWHARQIVALIEDADFIDRHPRVAQAWLLQCPGVDGASYRERVRGLFEDRFPPARYDHVYALLASLSEGRRAAFMMEKMLTGSAGFGWDMSIEKPESIRRFYTGIVTIDRLVGAHWMASLAADHPLKAYFEPWGSRELYNTFEDRYYQANVAPGGVGQAYDRVTAYFNETRAREACPGVMDAALAGTSD